MNGEEINQLGIKSGSVSFMMKGDCENTFVVSKECQATFINNLAAINQNGGIEAEYLRLNPAAI